MVVFSRYFISLPVPQSSTQLIAITQDLVARDEHLRENLKAEAHALPDIVLTEVRLLLHCILTFGLPMMSYCSVNYATSS